MSTAGPNPGTPTPSPGTTASPGAQGQALALFVNARIGGEPIPSTATSELMLKTVTKALGSASTLVDSPAMGLSGARPVTKTLRGAGVGVYLISETLAGRGIKRGLGLFVLALGGALVAISLITGSAPAWMTTLGFGLLLAGLAYAALASGSLALALVLATPVVPLLVWSATRSGAGQGAGATPVVQIVLVALLVGTLLIIGTVRDPQRRPSVMLSLRGLLGLAAVVLGLVLIGVVIRAVIVELPTLWRALLPWAATAALVVLGVLGLRHAYEVNRAAERVPEAGGRAIAAAWSWVYGLVYVLLAAGTLVALRRGPDASSDVETLLRALLVTFAVLAAVCFVLCLRVRVPKPRQQQLVAAFVPNASIS